MARGRLAASLAIVLAALAGAAPGCGGNGRRSRSTDNPGTAASEHFTGTLSPTPRAGADVVAEVNGSRIYADDVARQATGRGLSSRQALDELIAAELLAGEALRRGLADAPDAVEARRRERVRLLVEREFAATFASPEAVPDEDVHRVFARPEVHQRYNHPERRRILTYTVPLPGDATAPAIEAARTTAGAIAARIAAMPKASLADMDQAVAQVAAERGVDLQSARYETPRRPAQAPEVVTAAAFALATPGVAPPLRDAGGWTVVTLVSITAARHLTEAEAAPELRQQLFESSRQAAFARWADDHVSQTRVWRNPALDAMLDAIEIESPVGLP